MSRAIAVTQRIEPKTLKEEHTPNSQANTTRSTQVGFNFFDLLVVMHKLYSLTALILLLIS
jgi:hypothetical protein